MAIPLENDLPKATLIPQAEISVEAPVDLNFHVTAWSEPRHSLTSHIGTEPLEDGSLITDHVVSFPPRLSLKGYVSDVIEGSHAPEKTWEIIRQLHSAEVLMNVLTEWGYYKDMVMRLAETKQTGRGMEFMMEFQHVVRVGLDIVKIYNPKKPEAETKRYVTVLITSEGKAIGFDPNAAPLEEGGPSGRFYEITDYNVIEAYEEFIKFEKQRKLNEQEAGR